MLVVVLSVAFDHVGYVAGATLEPVRMTPVESHLLEICKESNRVNTDFIHLPQLPSRHELYRGDQPTPPPGRQLVFDMHRIRV